MSNLSTFILPDPDLVITGWVPYNLYCFVLWYYTPTVRAPRAEAKLAIPRWQLNDEGK